MRRQILLLSFLGVGLAHSSLSAALHAAEPQGVLDIRKVPVVDCRVVRGFLGTPVDGSVQSWDYRGTIREYPRTASDGVAYAYLNNDGLHIRLADGESFNTVVLRGGARARMYADVNGLAEPAMREPLCRFEGGREVQTIRLRQLVTARQVSFFGIEGGAIADVGFYRVQDGKAVDRAAVTWTPGPGSYDPPKPQSRFAPESLYLGMKERYGDKQHVIVPLIQAGSAAVPLLLEGGRPVHLVSKPLSPNQGLAAIDLTATMSGPAGPRMLTIVVQDPLDPRLDLMWMELAVQVPGTLELRLDIPDQVLLGSSQLWLTLSSDKDLELQESRFGLNFVSPEVALPEALAWRTLLMRSFFSLLSEPRPWGSYARQRREEFYASSTYAGQCPEFFMTIDCCHALAPADETVRQYREWVYLRNLEKLSEVAPSPEPPAGVPAWAWYARQAWLEVRQITQWWLDERLVPTGEFGGRVGDDTDLYQQFADLPFFEDTGVGARVRAAGAELAELADKQNLREGLNIHATDSLHAYEEGINHLALMARWFYGDPIYLERCMDSARNMEALTIVTADGRRHFRDKSRMGWEDIATPRAPRVDGAANPLMWHTALQVADYNCNPRTLKVLQEWADTWLALMRPGQWATDVEVLTGKVTGSQPNRPLYGGYSTQGVTFTWLYALTGQGRHVEPFLYYYRQKQAPLPANVLLGDVYCLGGLDALDSATLKQLTRSNPALAVYVDGDPGPLVQATIGNPRSSQQGIQTLYDARRWPDMYTTSHQFTDRVFPSLLQYASISYLGGFCHRNKFNPTPAVSWEGFGTDYAALVLRNRRDSVKLLVYSFASQPLSGRMRFWALAHGRYRLTVGPDANGDFQADRIETDESLELARADAIPLTTQPGVVTVVTLEQQRRLDPIHARADLAIAPRDVELREGVLSGTVHNLGSADIDDVVVTIVAEDGRTILRKSLGQLAAPLDLVPRHVGFTLPLPEHVGWASAHAAASVDPRANHPHGLKPILRVVLDPGNQVPELYEGNNEVQLFVAP
jgi:hypothetical protein